MINILAVPSVWKSEEQVKTVFWTYSYLNWSIANIRDKMLDCKALRDLYLKHNTIKFKGQILWNPFTSCGKGLEYYRSCSN